MTPQCHRIAALVTRIQNEFLDTPGLTLTVPKAQQRFAVGRTTCEAVLGVLVDAGVLAKTRENAYLRPFAGVDRHAA